MCKPIDTDNNVVMATENWRGGDWVEVGKGGSRNGDTSNNSNNKNKVKINKNKKEEFINALIIFGNTSKIWSKIW